MSRTIRRKNYEAENRTSWDNRGGKLAGFYTEREFHCVNGIYWHTYRVPTKAEYYIKYLNNHSDHSYHRSGPPKFYRKTKIRKYRMHDKTELRKFMTNEGYEPMCWDRISEGYWD